MVDKVQVKFELDGKQAQASLNKIATSLGRLEKKSVKSLGKATTAFDVFKGSFASSVAIGAFRAASRVIVGGISSIVSEASKIEDVSTQFKTLTGNAEDAAFLLKELQTFSASTPFQFNDLAQASKTMLAFGLGVDEILPRLQNLGDIAAATGGDIGSLALIFGQVSAAGKLTGERLIQLQERGVPVLDALAESFDKPKTAIQAMVTAGKISFADFTKALDLINKEGGLAFEGMIRQSKTFSGVVSTLSDNFSLLLADVGKVLLPVLKEAAIGLTTILVAAREFANSGLPGAILQISLAMNSVSTSILEMSIFMNENQQIFESAVITFGLFIVATKGLTVAAFLLNVGLQGLAATLTGLAVVMKAVGIGLLIAGVVFLVDAIRTLIGLLPELLGFFQALAGKIVQAVLPALGAMLKAIAAVTGIFNGALSIAIDKTVAEIDVMAKGWVASGKASIKAAQDAKKAGNITVADQKETNTKLATLQEQRTALLQQQETARFLAQVDTQEKLKALREEIKETKAANRDQAIALFSAQASEDFVMLVQKLGKEEAIRVTFEGIRLGNKKKALAEGTKASAKAAKKEKAIINDLNTFAKASNRERFANVKTTLGNIEAATQSSNKTLVRIGKAASIANGLVRTFEAANVALASAPPPFGIALAALVTSIGLANVASQQAVSDGFEQGGIVGGRSFTGDRLSVNVNSGEMILNRRQQTEMFNQLQGKGVDSQPDQMGLVNSILSQPIIVEINEREIARATRNASRAGFITSV